MRICEVIDPSSLTQLQHYMRSVKACVPYVKADDWTNPKLKFHAHQAYSYWFNIPNEEKHGSEFKAAEQFLKEIIPRVNLPRHNEKRREQAKRGEIEIDPKAADLAIAEDAGGTGVGAVATSFTGGKGKQVGSLFGGSYTQKSPQKRKK